MTGTPEAGGRTALRAPTRPRRPAGDATRRRLLDAGRVTFARHGFAGTPVQMVLDEAGVKAPALYHHFASKLGLFRAVAEEVYSEFIEGLATATRSASTFADAVDRTIATAGRLHAADPSLAPMAIMVQLEMRRSDDLRRELAPTHQALRSYVDSLVDLAPERLVAQSGRRALVLAVLMLLNGMSSLAVTLRDPEEFAAATGALRLVVLPPEH